MARFVHHGWLREHATVPLTLVYVTAALVLGATGESFGDRIFGQLRSPIASASAQALLSAIASGMMALTAIVFSLVLVAVQVGIMSFSPRLVPVLGRTRWLGHAMGLFTGTFVYALVAIRSVDLSDRSGINLWVVMWAFAWLFASIVVLVLLIPQIRSLTVAAVLATLYERGAAAAERVYPAVANGPPGLAVVPADLPITGVVRHTGRPRYLVGIDLPRLVQCATEAGVVIVIQPAIGDAVIDGDRLLVLLGGSDPVSETRLRGALWFAPERAIVNDPAYALRLLVDVAIRALSPAVNDPTTAVSVLDDIEGMLRLLGRRHLEDNGATDAGGVLRVVRAVPSWDQILELALTEIHQYGRDSVQVQRRLATLLRDLSEALPATRRPAIERFADWRAQGVVEQPLANGWANTSTCDRQGLGHPYPPYPALG